MANPMPTFDLPTAQLMPTGDDEITPSNA